MTEAKGTTTPAPRTPRVKSPSELRLAETTKLVGKRDALMLKRNEIDASLETIGAEIRANMDAILAGANATTPEALQSAAPDPTHGGEA